MGGHAADDELQGPTPSEREETAAGEGSAPRPRAVDASAAVRTGTASARPPAAGSGRREEILDGAAEMFAEYGYHGASLRDISSRVGISHSGMLHHFESKDALLDGVIDRLEEHAQTALDRAPELRTERRALLRGLAEIWHPASLPIRLLATLDAESVSEDHHGRYRVARLRKVHEHVLEDCFSNFAGQGLLREDADPAFAGRALLAMVLNLAVREKTVRSLQHRSHDDAPLKDLAMLVETFFLEVDPAGPPGTPSPEAE